MKTLAIVCATILLASAGCRGSTPSTQGEGAVRMKLSSTAFKEGEAIPRRFTGEGDDLSPPLTWTDAPPGARQFALIMDDPDAPTAQPWVHWVIYGLPAETNSLPEGLPRKARPTTQPTVRQGPNSFSRDNLGYRGPMPPPGHGVHHYHFRLYALDSQVADKPDMTKEQLLAAMNGHILATCELVGTYERKK